MIISSSIKAVYLFLPNLYTFHFPFLLYHIREDFQKNTEKQWWEEHSFLVPNLSGKGFSFLSLSNVSYRFFCRSPLPSWGSSPLFLVYWEFLSRKSDSVKYFSASITKITWPCGFSSLAIDMIDYINDFEMLNQPCKINLIWSMCIILFLYIVRFDLLIFCDYFFIHVHGKHW